MPASKAQRAATAERRTKAIQLRLAGVDWQTIATNLGYASRGAACQDVTRALEAHLAEEKESVDSLREIELQRLDRLQAGAWSAAAAGDLRAIETVLRVVDRRCKLLGLDAPTKHEVRQVDGLDAEIDRLMALMGSRGEGAAAPAATE
ncbi:hypothetical protein GCM10023196_037110 [Actinoallomurus vinaceus]|uniref:Terminase small subunit n=1 Tax=Actinoallomurus vinaceus TaxID=1080074 RepID=A0ABP8U9A6_9ACTN